VTFVAPREREAQERAWEVVEAAYAGRSPVAWPRKHLGPLAIGAVVAAIAAAALSPPGRSVVHSLREAVGVKQAEPALFSLPAPGSLLVTSRQGAWLIHADGSKRLLGHYADAAFSPHGLFVAATRANQLVVLAPDGEVRWTLARRAPRFPAWTGSRTDTRIAYLSGGRLRIVAGDGTGDYAVGPAALVPPVWRPNRVLVYSDGRRTVMYDANRRRVLRRAAAAPRVEPSIRRRRGQSEVLSHGRVVFRGTGVFGQVVSSPDRRWLLVSWPTANQWVFVRMKPRKIVGVARIAQQFGDAAHVEDWCCAP
jgi:hypothetical protein